MEVGITNRPKGHRISGNAIYSNGSSNLGLGIDLGADGVTRNDAGDGDTGPNGLQNFPELTSVILSNGNVQVAGLLNSAAGGTYRLEFFASKAGDQSGFGEGRFFLGSSDVITDGSGNASFNLSFPTIAGTEVLTATATDSTGNTSEFSRAVRFGGPNNLLNISTRMRVLTGENVLIGGFIITGTDPKMLLFRALGPSLGSFGVQGTLADPILELRAGNGALIASNDNWKDTQRTEIADTQGAPVDDRESALLQTIAPAAYTAIVKGKNNTTGVALVEAYDLTGAVDSSLANISTRGFVDTGDNVMIGGFLFGGGSGTGRVIVRGIGPSLASSGIAGSLQDPTLELRDNNGALLASNDNWKSTQQAEIEATTIPPRDDRESAIVATLPTGAFTAILRGKNNTTGVGLVEIYNLGN